jgi:hypothetical protein
MIHHQGLITCTLTGITCNGLQMFIICVVGVWRHILSLRYVCALRRICEPLQVIPVKVQVINP